MSWLSEWIRKLTNNPKIPAEVLAQKVTTRQLTVLGDGGYAELVATKTGVRFTLATPAGVKGGNYANLWVYKDGRVSFDLVSAETVRAAVDMTVEGVVVTRGLIEPVPPPTPNPDPSTPDGPVPPPALARPFRMGDRNVVPGDDLEDGTFGMTPLEHEAPPWGALAIVTGLILLGLLAVAVATISVVLAFAP